jgi:hypothetical protein
MVNDQRPFDSRVRESLIEFANSLRELAQNLPSADDDERKTLVEEAEMLAASVTCLIDIIEMHDAYASRMSDAWQAMRPEDRAKLSPLRPHDPVSESS